MLARQYLILIFGILAVFVFAGCVEFEVEKGPVDAIAVWQHQGEESWDVWYSYWDHSAKKWHVPPAGQAKPIAVDDGNDHDPDVSSNEDSAVAVWSKELENNRNIYFSSWKDYSWTSPSAVSNGDTDTDPTVAMDEGGSAMAVWVHEKKELHYSIYNPSTGQWSDAKKIDTSGIDVVSLPELTYSEYWGTYFLIFTGVEDGTQYAYEAFYWGGWHGPWWIDYDAVLDNNEPTDQRTGISGDRNDGFVTYVWPVTDGTLESYSYKYDFATYTFNLYGKDKMPDTAYDTNDVAQGIHTKNNDLYHQPNVNGPVAEKQVSAAATEDYRGSLTFILDKKVGLAVWWNKEDGPGEIFSSYYENNVWSTPRPIFIGLLDGYDRNPAVTPMQAIEVYEEIEPFCGDGGLDAGEECEVGIPCPDPNDVCWPDCKCYGVEYPYCGDGNLDAGEQCEAGIPCPDPTEICWIDCKCYKGKRPPPQPPPEEPPPLPPEEPTPEEPVEPEPTVGCKSNSAQIERLGVNIFDPSRQICSDDCDEGYVCDTHSCNCVVKGGPVITPRCGDGYISTQWASGGGNEECDTGNSTHPKPDTCPYPEVCISCKCVGPGDSVGCAVNTLHEERLGPNRFDNETMMCIDDCGLHYENYECDLESCTCKPKVEPECGNGEIEGWEDCEETSDCEEGYECLNCRCIYIEELECDDTEDCPMGWYCTKTGQCREYDEPCVDDDDCPVDHECSRSGECRPYGAPCTDDEDCASGDYCSKVGQCRDYDEPCEIDNECAPDEYCSKGGQCREYDEPCIMDDDCREGDECVAAECVPETPPVCGDGLVEGTEECELPEDCGDYYHCVSCACVPYTCGELDVAIPEMVLYAEDVESAEECDALVETPPIICHSTCWASFYRDGCCLGDTQMLLCEGDCPEGVYECPECPEGYHS